MSKTFSFFRLYIIFFTSYDNNHLSTNNNIYSNMHIIHNSTLIQKILTKLQCHFFTLAPIWMCLQMQLRVQIVRINFRHQYQMNGVNLLSHEHQYYTWIFLSAIKSMKIALSCMWSSPQKGQRRWKHNFFNHVISSVFVTKMNYFI